MNLRSYDKSTKMLKLADLAAAGVAIPGENNVLVVGIIDCVQNHSQAMVSNLAFGIRKENAVPLTFNLENFDYLKRLTPATAKYARNYTDFVAKSVAALVRTNLLDCVVAVVDNNVMGLGILEGCTRINCPVLLMPMGINPTYDETMLLAAGKLATREIKATEIDHLTMTYARQVGIAPNDTLSLTFFQLAEALGLTLPGASKLVVNQGATLDFAVATGVAAKERADDIITTKRLISKRTLTESLAQYQANGGNITGVLQFAKLLDMIELKIPTGLFPSLKGNLADEAYVVSADTAPLTTESQAWVYRSLTDALMALTSNAIDNGVIVLQNCLHCDVSIIVQTIVAMNKANDIALITDGYCATTPVLTVANITPNGFDNQDFANIQTGDTIEIDVTKGRLSTNVSSKDMKLRAKRNIAKKYEIYF